MMRLIDADKLESGEVIIPTENGGYEYVEVFYKDDVDNAPPVDAIEVIRCKDCKHYYADPWGWGSCVFEGGVSRRTKTNDFCSWGERKKMKDNSNVTRGIGFLEALQLAFLVLKLCKVINWEWIWVFTPLWVGMVIDLLVALWAVFIIKREERRCI